jgi:glycosyltransferase 2 family protein
VPPADSPPREGTRGRLRLTLRVVGILVAVTAVGICVKTVVDQWSSVSDAIRTANVAWLLGAFACSFGSMAGLGLLWWRCLHLFGSPAKPTAAIAWYFGGELGKYLPGGVWSVLGRGELAQRGGKISRSAGYATTLISYGTMCIAAAALCGVLSPVLALDGKGVGWAWALLALLPLGVTVVHPAVFGRVLALATRATRGRLELTAPPWSSMLGLIAWAIPTWILLGAAAAMVTEALGYDQHPARIAFAAVAAWILGFLAVPVPAGAGLRELVFVGICGLGSAPATAVAAIARALLLVVDGAGGVLGLWYTGRTIPRSGEPDTEDLAGMTGTTGDVR